MPSRTPPSVARNADPPRIPRPPRRTGSRGAEFCRRDMAAYAGFSLSAIREATGRPYGAVRTTISRNGATYRKHGGDRRPAVPGASTA